MSETKRLRHDWLGALIEYILRQGGTVHDALMTSENRTLSTSKTLAADVTVMKIPYKALIKADRIPSKIEGNTVNPLEDCLIAAYLASKPTAINAYLDSLPQSILLARHWSDDELLLLEPSPLLNRIRSSQTSVSDDYNLMKEKLPTLSFAKDAFDQGLAAVSSRAFDHNGSSVLVPLLDLCDHVRGSEHAKNLSYVFDDTRDLVVVKTTQQILGGSPLKITYGAQANGPLLLNYGFCIEPNIEPDGSSNDTYEFFNGHRSVHLRTGPKSYTYGCFCQALDLFTELRSENSGSGDPPDDMEAFLDECDAEEEEDEQFELEAAVASDDDEGDSVGVQDSEALSKLADKLKELRSGYGQSNGSNETSVGRYAAILLCSEIRAIYFFQLAVLTIQRELAVKNTTVAVARPFFLTDTQNEIIIQQVRDLSSAYMQIRHSNI